MALTPEEVINKRFQPTKFKEGYNPEEVDDFLDEIVIELRRLNAENASLKRQLEEAEAKISLAPAQRQGGALAGLKSSLILSPARQLLLRQRHLPPLSPLCHPLAPPACWLWPRRFTMTTSSRASASVNA